MSMNAYFDHERLRVYQDSIKFVAWATDILKRIPKSLAVWDQLDRACSSIPLNIANGNGKSATRDRCYYFDNARGSSLESAACLDVLTRRKKLSEVDTRAGKAMLLNIVSMLVGLLRSQSDRLHENTETYHTANNQERWSSVFDHEKLRVYQESLKFVELTGDLLDRSPKAHGVWARLDRSSTSVPLHIAEGNGRFTAPDRCRFFDGARRAALDCAACLDLLLVKNTLNHSEIRTGKEILGGIVSMLIGLIKSNSSTRLRDEKVRYRIVRKPSEVCARK